MPFSLPQLPYSYDALEPYIDARTMEVHHTKHHQKYTDKLNEAVASHPELNDKTIENILIDLDLIPEDIRTAVRNHGGGYANHNFFWKIMAPANHGGGGEPAGALADEIKTTFGSFAEFKPKFTAAAANQFGSGWEWLVLDSGGHMHITSTPNQDSPFSEGLTPLLAVDVWEHAYYLKYGPARGDYLESWWNVVNWPEVNRLFEQNKG